MLPSHTGGGAGILGTHNYTLHTAPKRQGHTHPWNAPAGLHYLERERTEKECKNTMISPLSAIASGGGAVPRNTLARIQH